MFENLKLFQLKGLKECELSGLGQINVICGKNNSGKSTVLEAINLPANRSHGKNFSTEMLEKLYKGTIDSFSFRNNSLLLKAYRELLKTVLQNKNVWYTNEFEEFNGQLKAAFVKSRDLKQYWNTTSLGNLSNEFSQLLAISIDTLLIPPKRQLELGKQIQAKDNIDPNGVGVLNQLFYCKNQPEGTESKSLYNRIQKTFTEISNGYAFDIYMNNSNMAVLNFSRGKDEWIAASDCGLGLQDLLVLLWFAIHPSKSVILIEEPESHIHPEMQRKLLEFLRSQTNKQFFLTSHSNVFVNSAYTDRIFYTQFNENIKLIDATSRASVLSDLGYSVTDNLVSDLVILVEGPKDVPVIEELLIKMGVYSNYSIKIWPLGGDIMDQLDLSVFAENYKLIALVDNDPLSSSIRKKFIDKCEEYNISIQKTERYAIENYFSLKALREVFENQIDSNILEINPNQKLEKQIGINVKRNNRKIAQAMTLDDISGTDLEIFLNRVIELCKS